jgi:prepilin-type N-terminal cleavage/methylation domain-containing protein
VIKPGKKKNKFGFTLIELLVVTGVIGIVLTIGLANYSRINRRQIFNNSVEEVLQDLRLAQDKAVSGEKPSACRPPTEYPLMGYKLEFSSSGTSYQIKAVCEGVAEDLSCKTGVLSSGVAKIDGPDSIFFKVLHQGAELDSAEERLTFQGYNYTREIIVTESGEIYPTELMMGTPTPGAEPTETIPPISTVTPQPTSTATPSPTSPPGGETCSSQLLTNPSFETGSLSGWNWVGPVGAPRVAGSGGSCSCTANCAHQGSYGLWTYGATHADYLYQDVSLSQWQSQIQAGSARIEAQGWFGCAEGQENGWDWVSFVVRAYDSDNQEIISGSWPYSWSDYDQHEWIEINFGETIPFSAARVRIEVYVSETDWDACGADDFSLRVCGHL